MEVAVCEGSSVDAAGQLLRRSKIVQRGTNSLKPSIVLPRQVDQLPQTQRKIIKKRVWRLHPDADEVGAHQQRADRQERSACALKQWQQNRPSGLKLLLRSPKVHLAVEQSGIDQPLGVQNSFRQQSLRRSHSFSHQNYPSHPGSLGHDRLHPNILRRILERRDCGQHHQERIWRLVFDIKIVKFFTEREGNKKL